MRKFDTQVQYIKYRVLKEVAKNYWDNTLYENIFDIPKTIIPGSEPTMRCCVYKERAIISKRIKLAMGGNKKNPNIIEVIDIACEECPVGGYEVTNACCGCLAHRCESVCKFGAISFDYNHVAHIDKAQCKECGACSNVCPFGAIVLRVRPCQNACKVNAITVNEHKAVIIDDEKCITCGACLYQCPFGAIMDKSFILDVIDLIKNSENHTKYKLFAVVAPSISSQFKYAKLGQVIKGIKELGFYEVVEAAFGADMVALKEGEEVINNDFLTSSCCPAFVDYIRTNFPDLVKYISKTLSPMAMIGKYIKEHVPNSKVVFIGPCTAKKKEFKKEEVSPYIDSVLTFEELQSLFGSKNIDISTLEEEPINNASYFGRIFAKSGGLVTAIKESLLEQGLESNIEAISCNGITECKQVLTNKQNRTLTAKFIEGMACVGGCVGGAGCLTHGEFNKAKVEKHSKESSKNTITSAVESFKKLK